MAKKQKAKDWTQSKILIKSIPNLNKIGFLLSARENRKINRQTTIDIMSNDWLENNK